jgi:hypothetical protein
MKRPLPTSIRGRIAELRLKHCVDFPLPEHRPHIIRNAAWRVTQTNGRKYMTRTILEDGKRLIRVWRLS